VVTVRLSLGITGCCLIKPLRGCSRLFYELLLTPSALWNCVHAAQQNHIDCNCRIKQMSLYEYGGLSHTKGITAWIFPARVLHLQEADDYLGCWPTCIIRHMTFHPTGCDAEGNYLSKEGAWQVVTYDAMVS